MPRGLRCPCARMRGRCIKPDNRRKPTASSINISFGGVDRHTIKSLDYGLIFFILNNRLRMTQTAGMRSLRIITAGKVVFDVDGSGVLILPVNGAWV